MDYLENRLNDDVMSIIYKKIHQNNFENSLFKIKYFFRTYCFCCSYLGALVSFYEDAYLCYSCTGLDKSYDRLKELRHRKYFFLGE
jgi:hypothetical protein